MSYLQFKKDELVNLEYSLAKEFLGTNRSGGYCSSSIICCNTRKYHGLLVLPIEALGGNNHVLLSSLDETIIENDREFNLGIHKYPELYSPRGHKYIIDVSYEPVLTITYAVGEVKLKKEIAIVHNRPQIMLRYTLLDAGSEIDMRLKPFLAYREIHQLSKANMNANTRYEPIKNGIKSKLYPDFPGLRMQISKENEFIAAPDWYYNVEYTREQKRGYDYREDLFVPGYFEFKMKKGESIVFSASIEDISPEGLKRSFTNTVNARSPRDSFKNCLKYSASQFIIKNGKDTEIVAGYPWFGRWGRDTFISLPGITLCANRDVKACKDVLDTMSREIKNGLFPNIGKNTDAAYNSADAPMWYFWAIMQYEKEADKKINVWKEYGDKMNMILEAYRNGANPSIKMHDNGLIFVREAGKALTWMDAVVEGRPVTPRSGYQVEINALWYNAICYCLDLANKNKDVDFIKKWSDMPEKISKSFIDTFWIENSGYLADYVDESGKNDFIRPNQIIACSLDYSPITDDMKNSVIKVVKSNLLTPKGLRTLSPRNKLYKGIYEGNQRERDEAYHQGTVWPWLLGHYIEANIKLKGQQGLSRAKEIIMGFEEDMTNYGLCSIAEIYDGNPPHISAGTISQAWSVGEVLRSLKLIEDLEKSV